MVEGIFRSSYESIKSAIEKLKKLIFINQNKLSDLAKTNLDLGLYHLREGNINDAILRFRIVLLFDKKNAHALYNMARAYLAKDEKKKAASYIDKCLKLYPNNLEATFFKRLFDKNTDVKEVPISIIKSHYDNFAQEYDAEFDINRGYFSPRDLVELLAKYSKSPKTILDLGCGTGSVGFLLKEKFPDTTLTGVEISEKMISALQEKQKNSETNYDLIIENDIWEFLLKTKKKFSVISANLSFHYSMNLHKTLTMAKKCLEKNGILIFTVEKAPNNKNGLLNLGNENFQFTKKFILDEIKAANLQLLGNKETSIKNDRMAILCACQNS